MNFVAPDLKEGSKAWTLIDAKCAEIVAKHPRMAGAAYRASLINLAIAQSAHEFLPDRRK